MKYINIKNGAIIETESLISGKYWEVATDEVVEELEEPTIEEVTKEEPGKKEVAKKPIIRKK